MVADKANKLVKKGLSRKLAGDLPGAVKAFQQALAIDPTNHLAKTELDLLGKVSKNRNIHLDSLAKGEHTAKFFFRDEKTQRYGNRDATQADDAGSQAFSNSDIGPLLTKAADRLDLDDYTGAMELVEKVLAIDPGHPTGRELLRRCEETLLSMYQSKLGDLKKAPRLCIQPDEIVWLNLDNREGFILSLVDGRLRYEDLFLLSGMDQLETARILAHLVQNKVIG